MAKTYEELLEQAAIIRDETAAGKNTAERVGGTITDAVDYVKELKDTYAGIHAEAAEAKTAAAAAKSTASEAKTNAGSARSIAQSALLTANAAKETADAAKKESAQAVSTAQAAQTKNAEQDNRLANAEEKNTKQNERLINYVYPKLYQLNEGAGAHPFDGMYSGSASVLDVRKTVAEEGFSYKVVFSSGKFLLQEISPGGVTVGLYQEWDKIISGRGSSEDYTRRDCLYYIYVEGEGSTYYYIDSKGVASEQSATYLLRRLVDKNAAAIATLQGKDAAQDVEIATLHEHDTALDGKISALEAKDIEHNSAIVRNATVEYYDHSVTDGPSRINTRAIFKFFGADGNQLFMATLLGAGNGYPGLLSLKNKTKLDGYADTFTQNPAASSESNGLMSAEDKRKLDSLSLGEIIDLPWDDEVQGQDGYINNFTERGEYHIHGERLYANDGLPILNAASGHTIDGLMTVLDSSLPNGNKYDVCVTQILRLNNRVGGDGHIFVRTGIAANKAELKKPTAGGWSTWEKLMGVFEKNAVSNATELNEYTSSGMYDGMFVFSSTSQTEVSGLKIESGSTFLMVVVNGYAVGKSAVPQVTQLLYVMPSGLDGSSGVRNAKLYTRTGIYVATAKTYTWGKFDRLAYESDISKLAGYIQENSDLIQGNQSAIAANTKEIARVNSTATRAQETADRAQDAADAAKSAAKTAQTAATSAQETANSARETATAASTAATEAQTAAQEAKTAAETAQATATAAQTIAQDAKETAEDAKKIKEYKLLHSHTFPEDATSSYYELLTADDGTPIHQYKDILIFAELSYVEGGSNMTIFINTNKWPQCYISQITNQSYLTNYIFKLKIDGQNSTLYLENHTNSWANGQYGDGKQGLNFFGFNNLTNVFTYDRLTIEFPFKANNKILIYGR